MNRKTRIIGAAAIAIVIVLAIIALVATKNTKDEKMEDTKNLAMYVPYGDGQYIMVDQENGSIYTITMPEDIYGKDGEKITADDLKKGNIVAIYGNGIMLESYPGQYPGVTKVEVVEEGKESDADQYQDIIDEIYQEPDPAERPAINIEYRTESAVIASIATEGSFNWTYTDAEGETHSEKTDSPHILAQDTLMDLTIDENTTDLSFTFTSEPETVQVLRWPVELRESDNASSEFPEGESVDVKKDDKAYVISDVKADYVYKVMATWENGAIEYGFYTKH